MLLAVLLLAGLTPGWAGTRVAEAEGDYAKTLQFTVRTSTPTLATDGDTALTVTGTVRNTGKMPVGDLSYIAQRGRPLADAAAVRAFTAKPTEPTALITQRWTTLGAAGTTLAPGASISFTMTVPIRGDAVDTLHITTPGVYPVMFNVNGDLQPSGADSFHARLGELYLLLPVNSSGAASLTGPATAVGLLWPVVDRPHIGVDGVFLDDDLAAAIRPGGRLSLVLNTLQTMDFPAGSVTLVVDPELLDELDQMSRGYRVRADQSHPQPALQPGHRSTSTSTAPSSGPTGPTRVPTTASTPESGTAPGGGSLLPSAASRGAQPAGSGQSTTGAAAGTDTTGTTTSTTSTQADPAPTAPTTQPSTTPAPPSLPDTQDTQDTVAGTGAQLAADYLDELREAAREHPVLVLPYSDPDAVALADAQLLPQLAATVTRGRSTAARLLPDATLIDDISYPVDGLADQATVDALSGMGYRGVLLSGSGLHGTVTGGISVQLPRQQPSQQTPPQQTDTDLPGLVIDTSTLSSLSATELSDLAAGLAAPGKSRSPLVLAPDRRWSPDTITLRKLLAVLTTLEASGRIVGLPLAQAATSGGTPATLQYPKSAADAELTDDQLQRVVQAGADIDRMRRVLHRDDTAKLDPAELLDPLQAALTTGFAAAYRTDDTPIVAVLDTVQDSLAQITGRVTLAAGGRYQLASASSPLRIPVSNDLPYAVTLQIAATRSEAAVTVDPVTETIPAGRRMQVQLPTTVRQQGGAFPMQVVLRYPPPDSRPWSAPVQIVVSSHAYDALTIVLLLAAGGVLALMVVLRITQRIRAGGRKALESTESNPAESVLAESTSGPAGADSTFTAGGGHPGNEQQSQDDDSEPPPPDRPGEDGPTGAVRE